MPSDRPRRPRTPAVPPPLDRYGPSGGRIAAVDLFCGAGGLSYGLQQAGVPVVAGIDIDPASAYPFESNIEAPFLQLDVADVSADHLAKLWSGADVRVLAGCAPCQPFSAYRRGIDTTADARWPLLGEFGRLVAESQPDIVTMENVTRIARAQVFLDFTAGLREQGYYVDWRSCNGVDHGLGQQRRRIVLLASTRGPLAVPAGDDPRAPRRTVRDTIEQLPPLQAGAADPDDALHVSRTVTDVNMRRLQASTPGGSWQDWPEELRAPCHRRATGSSFRNVYGRMEWDSPSPTITTLAHNFGAGRFGHPAQDRAISLREAAMLQGFPRRYRFVRPGDPVHFSRLGRLIGNAVPPPLGAAVGRAIVDHVTNTPGRAQSPV